MTASLPLMKNVLTPFFKTVLIPSGLTAAAPAIDEDVQRKFIGQLQRY